MKEISLHILDLVQNSIRAQANIIHITVDVNYKKNLMAVEIIDNGKGMKGDQIKKVSDPFYTTRIVRNVGLGVPLFKMAAELTGGTFSVHSCENQGTTIKGEFRLSSIDMLPLGDINNTILILIKCNPNLDFIYTYVVNERKFTLDTRDIRDVLGNEIPLDSIEVTNWICDYLKEQTEFIAGGFC